ncbi:hypothetical protein Agabi119p4_4551 [Agaricus bisporus var. burnettii]|uniref:Ricin B lectin domain-containing protein n=1 Tax=Agaricus bisporus var. burnettii TaxID=192524 RepID=A0A8H7F3I4_AGABI|nr:hypothetical protein Agabi119p4_4551 [Agaricus bisporus var. burnettii]
MALGFLAFCFACCLALVTAIPTFEHFNAWDTNMGSLVPGASYVEMMASKHKGNPSIKRYLNTFDEGAPGNITLWGISRRPEWFYIRQNKLYQVINSTAIYPVNAHNITGTDGHPLQLISAENHKGNRYGTWRWQGSMLFYEEGNLNNGGLFYECKLENQGRGPGVFTFLIQSRPPPDCSPLTLHGFDKILVKEQSNPAHSI